MRGDAVPRLAFSTLACPEWTAATVVRRAAAIGFDAIEWRGGPDGTVRTAWGTTTRRSLRGALDDAGLGSIAVTTYTNLISGAPDVVTRSIDDAAAHAELAADLAAPVIRVFLGIRDDEADEAELARRAGDALARLLERTRPIGITVAIEPHDAHVHAASIRPILAAIDDPALGVVWDIGNAWSVGERPADGLAAYDGRIAYVQLKDGTGVDEAWRLSALGQGEVPLDEALRGLTQASAARRSPVPPISLEWERAWHEHLDPAEVALPAAHAWMREHVHRAVARGAGADA